VIPVAAILCRLLVRVGGRGDRGTIGGIGGELAENGRIAITQLRRLATVSMATLVGMELDVKLGAQVGYAVSLEAAESKATRLRFCTHGLLLAQAQKNQIFRGYSCIIIDEVHKRSMKGPYRLTCS
jgi:HrpA-like RNA helicase